MWPWSKPKPAPTPVPVNIEPQTTPIPAKPAPFQLTKADLLMGRDKTYASEYSAEISANLDTLLVHVNKLLVYWGKPVKVTSGWRPAAINAATPGAAKKSNHMKGLACDISDNDKALGKWCASNQDKLAECGLWMENNVSTPTWTHLQCVPPGSGNRVFIP